MAHSVSQQTLVEVFSFGPTVALKIGGCFPVPLSLLIQTRHQHELSLAPFFSKYVFIYTQKFTQLIHFDPEDGGNTDL
jgi:hypothetical protein